MSVSKIIVGFLFRWKQWVKTVYLWNKDEPDLIRSSFRLRTSLQKPHLWARLKKASILPTWAADTNTPQAERAYNKRDTIRPTKTVFNWSGESPWLRSSRNKYIRWLHCFKSSVTCKSYDKLCCKTTPSDLTWSTNATPSTEGTKLNRSGQSRRNTISLVFDSSLS